MSVPGYLGPLAAAALLFAAAPPASAGLREGLAALERYDYQAALHEFADGAAAGDREAQYRLGMLYYLGRGGIAQDYGQAAQWFRRAAEAGHPKAQYFLGTLHALGRGVPKDLEAARRLFRTSMTGLADAAQRSAKARAVMIDRYLEAPAAKPPPPPPEQPSQPPARRQPRQRAGS